jgi:hypothetical protein
MSTVQETIGTDRSGKITRRGPEGIESSWAEQGGAHASIDPAASAASAAANANRRAPRRVCAESPNGAARLVRAAARIRCITFRHLRANERGG